ncbi:MAG: hypothetical protein M3530_03640 [Thermoproteota archaeon]|nr:hypothetical protein [Thermoproteota archaeon]
MSVYLWSLRFYNRIEGILARTQALLALQIAERRYHLDVFGKSEERKNR